ncbi:hypothetical protein MHM582_3362 [Microbacterium sp. HM58-2]|nr:hypothetical protein MHM582_3362 [Microbacterium sp. HM58-2]
MSKTTLASAESSLNSALTSYKESAASIKEAHRVARQTILDDEMISDKAKHERLEALKVDTRSKLDGLRGQQDSYVDGLRTKLEKELRGHQPNDANSVLLRRDAAERARRIVDQQEALDVLNDAIANGDDTLAHAIGARARNTGLTGIVEVWKTAYPETADSAAALAYVEANTSGGAYNLSNQMTYADPVI